MGNVMMIPARRQVGNNARKQEEDKPKLRVAAYCRVSTDSDEQATSYESQVEHYTEYIQKNPDWEFADIYVDMYNRRLIQCPAHGSVKKRLNKGFQQIGTVCRKPSFLFMAFF